MRVNICLAAVLRDQHQLLLLVYERGLIRYRGVFPQLVHVFHTHDQGILSMLFFTELIKRWSWCGEETLMLVLLDLLLLEVVNQRPRLSNPTLLMLQWANKKVRKSQRNGNV